MCIARQLDLEVQEEPSEEDPSEDDSSGNYIAETAGLEVQAAPGPPAPHQIVPAPLALPYKPAILVQPRQAIPFGRPYRDNTLNGVAAPPPLSSVSSSGYSSSSPSRSSSSSPSRSSSSAPLSPYSGSSRRRSCSSSPSSETSHSASSSPPRKRRMVLIYSSLLTSLSASSSVGPSHKRCRSPTPPLPAAAVSTPPIEMLLPHKRYRGTSSAPQEGVHVEAMVEAILTHHG
ncbi:hypothetical protein Tco_0945869 [Tanacetum coccineum]